MKPSSWEVLFTLFLFDSLHGFGEFLCVILALSTVANNIPNMYSVALSAQSAWSLMKKVPRVFWTIASTFAVLDICIPAYYKFDTVIENFMSLIGYYLAIYTCMCLSEHFIWRKARWSSYDYENFKDNKSYPVGYAGVFGFCCGCAGRGCAGVVVGMNQVWYSGVLARRIGQYGGELGFELAGVFSVIGFSIVRYFELKYMGR